MQQLECHDDGNSNHYNSKLEKCAVASTCRPTLGKSRPIPIAKVNLTFDLLTSGSVHAKVMP